MKENIHGLGVYDRPEKLTDITCETTTDDNFMNLIISIPVEGDFFDKLNDDPQSCGCSSNEKCRSFQQCTGHEQSGGNESRSLFFSTTETPVVTTAVSASVIGKAGSGLPWFGIVGLAILGNLVVLATYRLLVARRGKKSFIHPAGGTDALHTRNLQMQTLLEVEMQEGSIESSS